jgi:putative ABC transport system ATP-binding protein
LAANKVIEVENLVKTYGQGDTSVNALKGISVTVNNGEFLAIMGPSGSGKSTFMHLIGCLDKPTSGHYQLDGQSIENLNDNQLATIRNEKIGFVFQQYNLLARTTTLENVLLPLNYAHGKRKNIQKRATQILDSVGLKKKMNKWPNELSGGEQQRVAIARAIINDPAIIMADEPTGALDTKTGQEVMAIFEKLNKEGKTIVLITHEPEIALHAHRTILLRDGKIESDLQNGNRKVAT